MNKLFSKIAALSVGLAMAVGVGVAVGSKEAKVVKAAGTDSTTYELINSVDQLETGKSYIITNGTSGTVKAIAINSNNNNRKTTDATVTSGKITRGSNVMSFTLGGKTGEWTFATENYAGTAGYLASAASGNNNYLRVISDAGKATISFSGDAAVINIGPHSSRTLIRYNPNNGSPMFACYSSGQQAIYLWKEFVPSATYTVSFNGNGGTGSMSAVSGVSGSYTLPDNGFTAPSNKAFAGWKAGNGGDLIPAGGSYDVSADVTFFAQWADAYNVTYTAGTHGTGTYVHASQPAGNYALLPAASLTGISADSGYRIKNYTVGGVEKNPGETITLSGATSVTVNFEVIPEETTYVFATNFATYASSWTTTYGEKTVAGKADVGGDYEATIKLTRVNKQSNGVGSDKPYVCPNTASDEENLVFTLTEEGKKIKDVVITYEQRGSNAPVFKLFKGSDVTKGTALDTAAIGTKNTLETTDLNDISFSISGNAGKSGNVGAGLTSIYISVEDQAEFGEVDHITVTSFPNTVYHVGEKYDSTGLAVTAYDGADESKANFKDVTSEVVTGFVSGTYTFDDDDVPTAEMFVEYTEKGTNYYADPIVMHVYALAEYELVTSEPTDWSGQYLIVSSNTVEEETTYYAMNGALSPLDVDGNHKTVSPDANDVIEAGQELEWTISAYSDGYSIQGKTGKYIGWANGSANGLTESNEPLKNTLSISGSTVSISGTGTGRTLKFNTDSLGRFRYYQNGNSVQLYKLKTSDKADQFAQTFLGAFTCDSTGESEPTFTIKEGSTKWSWALLATEYDTLSAAEKEQFRLGVASKEGDNIAQALARYDFVVGKYGTAKYADFMSRNPAPIGVGRLDSELNIADHNTTMIIVIAIAATSAIALSLLLVLKKRKHN